MMKQAAQIKTMLAEKNKNLDKAREAVRNKEKEYLEYQEKGNIIYLGAKDDGQDLTESEKEELLKRKFTYDMLVDGLKEGKFKKIVVVTGAGISVSAGIPDFRSPKTGIYDNLKEYDLPNPESIFDINYFE